MSSASHSSSSSSTATTGTATPTHLQSQPSLAGALVYKGKVTRSWPQLPDELVRHIATFYLWDASATGYCPHVWDTRELWHNKMVYTSIRDALLIEKNLMPICPQWSKALETHYFWLHATALIDPLDCLAHHAIIHPPKPPPLASEATTRSSIADTTQHQDQPTRLTPYCHYRNILTYSCHVCRVNQPNSSVGLTLAKRVLSSPLLGSVTVCREHERRRIGFCGICMREAPLFEGNTIPPSYSAAGINANTALSQAYNGMSLESIVSCLENEDEETWPGVSATCRFCRREWLWRKASSNPRDREAVGGSKLASEDWETRQCVEGFIDLAEGSINDVIALAREKWWLRKYTKLGDMMLQALAAARFTNANAVVSGTRRGNNGGEDNLYAPELEEEEEEEEDEEDPELMQLTEEGGVRELALGDWARSRILDGHWFSPADLWYRHAVPGRPIAVPALHPCPWARDNLVDNDAEEQHPLPSTVSAEIPPSYGLCEQAYIAHQRQMRVVLLPAMRNIVRRLVIECLEDAKTGTKGDCTWGGTSDDPAMRASKLNLEDVVKILREEEGVWFDGVDWAERRRNNARDQMAVVREPNARFKGDASDSKTCLEVASNSPTSTTGSGSSESSTTSESKSGASSNATSPVLSASTLQTTPSPPPISSSSPPLDPTPREGADGDVECPDLSMPESTLSNGVLLNSHTASGGNTGNTGKKKPPPLPPRPPPRVITIAVAPVQNPPRLLRPIPYVPVTSSHLPHYSIEAFRAVWREACAPLYHCRCKICERAMAKANADATTNAQTNGSVPIPSSQAQEVEVRHNPNTSQAPNMPSQGPKRVVEIKLDESTEPDGEGEEEVEDLEEYAREEGVEYEEYEEEEDLEVSSTFGEYGEARDSCSPSSFSRTATTPDRVLEEEEDPEDPEDEDPPEDTSDPSNTPLRHRPSRLVSGDDSYSPLVQRSRKRSCDELDEEEGGDVGREEPSLDLRRKKEGTPPKRARKGDRALVAMDHRGVTPLLLGGVGGERTVVRMRKRSSEELEGDDGGGNLRGPHTHYNIERTRRNSRDVRNGREGRGGRVVRGSDDSGGGGSSSDRERGDSKTAPHKRLKVSEGGRTRGSDGSSVSSPPLTTSTTLSDQDVLGGR